MPRANQPKFLIERNNKIVESLKSGKTFELGEVQLDKQTKRIFLSISTKTALPPLVSMGPVSSRPELTIRLVQAKVTALQVPPHKVCRNGSSSVLAFPTAIH